jgi:hypothetical protein
MKRGILRWIIALASIAIVAGFSFSQIVIADPTEQPSSSSDTSASAPSEVNDATLRKVAAVFPEMRRINQETQASVQNISDQHERDQLVSQARSKQLDKLRQVGLSERQYESVIVALASNPALMQRFEFLTKGHEGS